MKYELIVAINLCSCTDGPPATCCLELRSSRVSLERVKNYRIQTKGLCPIKAVVIQTVSGKSLCSDPNSNWTQRAMRKVDKEREQDPVPTEAASADGSRGRADPVTTTELPLKRRRNRVKPRQKSKKEKSKTSTKAHKGPKEKRSERGDVKGKNKKGKN
ncbi:C-C motif chemokine 2-like [Ctenopharyngodon idella]|uniref:C-C motif chemokine 2-like n=1 Tax=Ctenopharyngodon idella TaxID=7959 RepID=UPI00222F6C31|nr:C-C motif chemokine 2-like [Ctenopharyngodon idella]